MITKVDRRRHVNYGYRLVDILKSASFNRWLSELKDIQAKARVEMRIRRLGLGNPGDVKPVGEGVSEMRIDCGPGYRVYFTQRGVVLVLLLCGGDKSTQLKDIALAKRIAADWKE